MSVSCPMFVSIYNVHILGACEIACMFWLENSKFKYFGQINAMVDDFVFYFLVVGKAYEGERWIGSNSEEAKSWLCKGECLFHSVSCLAWFWLFSVCILSVFTLQNFQLLARTSFLFSRSGCFTHLQHGKLSEMCYKLSIRKIDSLFVIFSAWMVYSRVSLFDNCLN